MKTEDTFKPWLMGSHHNSRGAFGKSSNLEIEGWAGAAVIGGGALVGAGAGIFGSISSANAQKDAASAAKKSQKDANLLNKQMYDESRGSAGSAVLPTYLKNPDGSLFEGSLGTDLIKAYGDTAMPLATFQAATGKMMGAQASANKLTDNIFNGGVTREMLDNAAPVQTARLATARSSSLDALHRTLDEIDSTQAQRGYVGDSYGNRLLKFQAGRSQGDAVGAADLTNKQETADIKNYGDITLPMNNITLPFSMEQQNVNQVGLAQNAYLNSLSQRMQPFNMLKLGYTGPFQAQPLPTAGPGAYSGTANAVSAATGAVSQAGGAYMQYLQQQNQNAMMQQYLNSMSANPNYLGAGAYRGGTPIGSMDIGGYAPPPTDMGGGFGGISTPSDMEF